MALFYPHYIKEGPGIEKDAPTKTGLALFFEILLREFWQLLKLNLLFVVVAPWLVSFGAARGAMTRCTMNMVRDMPNDVWDDFRQGLKRETKRNTILGFAELFCIGILFLMLQHPVVQGSVWIFTLVLMCAVFAGLFFSYLWPMAVTIDLPLGPTVKNALVLSLACLHHSLPGLMISAILYGLSLWLFPLSLPLVLFIPFGMSSFITSFAAWSDIKRLVLRETMKNGGNKND